jgi:hypothetical protein
VYSGPANGQELAHKKQKQPDWIGGFAEGDAGMVKIMLLILVNVHRWGLVSD